MAITRLSSTTSATGLTTAVPAGLGYITETSFSQGGITATGTATANYAGRNATTIAFGNDTWVMFGTKGAHAWSHNGTEWFSGKGPLPINQGRYFMDYVSDAIYANGQWVAVTRLGRIFTGTNQHTWTERTSPFGGTYINKVRFGNGYYVAVANNGKFAYSTDAITWTLSNNAAFSSIHDIYALTYAAGTANRWVMAGTNGRMAYSTNNTPLAWTAVTTGFGTHTTLDSNSNVYDMQFNGTIILSVGGNGRFSTSPDGIFWDAKTQVSGAPEMHRVVWAASTSQWIVAGAGQTSTYWSATGNTFNATSVTYATNYFGSNGSDMNNSMNQTIPIATDGQTKVALMTYTGGDQILQYTTSTSFTNLDSRIVNFGKIRQDNASNPDSWQMTALPVGYGNLEMIAKGTNKILAFLSQRRLFGGFHFFESLDNGKTWFSAQFKVDPTGTGANLGIGSGPSTGTGTKMQIAFLKIINGVWFMGASNGTVYTSLDGETWLSEFNVGSHIPITVEYGNDIYVAISTDNRNFYRTSGKPNKAAGQSTTWTQISWNSNGVPGAANPNDIGYSPKFIKWVGEKWVMGFTRVQSLYHSSDNGVYWRSIDGNPTDYMSAIGDRGTVWGNSTYTFTSTSTQMGDDFIFDYNNGVAIASMANGTNSSNAVINLTISNNLQSWSHHYGMNGRLYNKTDSGYLYNTVESVVSTNDQFPTLGRHENANFGTIPGERQHAFNNAQVPVVQVFGDIPMAFIGRTARRGDASQGTDGAAYGGGSHGYVQWRNGMNLPMARGYFTRQTLRAYPISKFVQAGNVFLSIGYCDQDQGTQPYTSNAGYFGIYEVPAVDLTKI
jgi:hypothetical protein